MFMRLISICLTIALVASIIFPSWSIDTGTEEITSQTMDGANQVNSQSSGIVANSFTENIGQVENNDVLFYSASGSIAFASDSVYLYSGEGAQVSNPASRDSILQIAPEQTPRRNVVRLSFPGSNTVNPVGDDIAPGRSNYLTGSDATLWHTGVNNYHAVIYKNLWDGIDLAYRMKNGSIKYEFILHPNANPGLIQVKVEGHEAITISSPGEMKIDIGQGRSIIDSGLDVFYADNVNEKVSASFVLLDEDIYSYSFGHIDSGRTLIIDPLIYSTFLGGSGFDYGVDVAVGNDGCAYVTGYTDSPNFPTTFGTFDSIHDGSSIDIFVAKMGLHGDSFVYSTFIGDVSHDYSQAIAVDASGCAYITGYTMSYGFPTTQGAYDKTYNGDSYDAFVTKLSPFGDSLIYSTFLGGFSSDWGYGIAVDSGGYAYVTGDTWSANFPITPNAAFRTFNGGTTGANDIFVTKLSQLGNSIIYSTFLGGNDYESSGDIAVDSNGYAYITGQTRSASFPITQGAFDRTHNGGYDVFVSKISQSGTTLIFSTFLGGGNSDYGCDIAVGVWGHIYVTGYSTSVDFPTTSGAYGEVSNGWIDAFVTMLGKFGEELGYSTYLGGASSDYGYGIALDSLGSAYVTGYTSSSDYPATADAYDGTFNGATDAFMSKVSTSGTLLRSTYLGGAGNDYGRGIAIGASGFAYLAGETTSSDFPITPGALDTSFNGNTDAFVTKLDVAAPSAEAGPNQRILERETAFFAGAGSADNHGITNYTWTFYDGSGNVTKYGITSQHAFTIPGIYTVMLNVSDASGNWDADTMIVTVLDITHPIAEAGPDQIINEDTLASFNGSASTDNVGVVNYSWMFIEREGTKAIYGISPAYNFTIPGTYIVTLKVMDEAGNDGTDTMLVAVTDTTRPTANAGSDQRVFKDTTVKFDGSASNDNVAIVNYTWNFNDGIGNKILYGPTQSILFSVPGIYAVTLKVTDAMGYFDTDEMTLTVLEIIKPVAEAGPDMIVREREPTGFDGSASTDNVGVAQWSWSFNDGLNDVTLFGASPTWIFMVSGVYAVTLNVSDAAGNWDTDIMTVNVLDTTSPIAIAGPNQIVAEGTVVTFSASGSTDRSGITNYTWIFTYNGTLVTLGGASPSFQFWTPGSYPVSLTVQDAAGNMASEDVIVTVLSSIIHENALWPDDYGWILISLSIALMGVALLIHRRRKVIRP